MYSFQSSVIIQKQSRLLPMRWISFAVLVIFLSCSNKKDAPDVSHIKIDVAVQRFDRDFFALDTAQLKSSLQQIGKKYPDFLQIYFEYFAPVREIAAQNNT